MTAPSPHRMSGPEWGVLLILALIWGSSFLFIELALRWLPTTTLVWARVTGASIVLTIVARWRGVAWRLDRTTLGPYVVMATLYNVAPFLLIVWAQTHITSGHAAILNATTPLFGVLFAHVLTRDERLSLRRGAGVVVAFVGVVVVIGPRELLTLRGQVLPPLAVLGAAACYALGAIYGRRWRDHPPLVPAVGQVLVASLMLAPVMLWRDRPWTLGAPPPESLLAIAMLAAVCTAGAYMFLFWLLARAGATNIMLVTFLIPINALFLGALILGEQVGAREFGGIALIGAGLAVIDGRPLEAVVRWWRPRGGGARTVESTGAAGAAAGPAGAPHEGVAPVEAALEGPLVGLEEAAAGAGDDARDG